MKLYQDLFSAFFRIGIMTFGGGYAMLPMMRRELIERYRWITEDELLDYFAIGQCTPGIIAVNTATFVGAKTAGTKGAVVSTLGIIMPSLLIITVIAAFIANFAQIPQVQWAFSGIRVVVLVLILDAVLTLWKKGVKDRFGVCIALMVLLSGFVPGISSSVMVILCAVIGIVHHKVVGGAAK